MMTNWNMRTEELKLKDGGTIKNYHYEFNSTDRVAAKIVEDVFKAIMDISADRKDEPQMEKKEIEIALEMALNNCKTKHKGCRNCDMKCAWRDEPHTERRKR